MYNRSFVIDNAEDMTMAVNQADLESYWPKFLLPIGYLRLTELKTSPDFIKYEKNLIRRYETIWTKFYRDDLLIVVKNCLLQKVYVLDLNQLYTILGFLLRKNTFALS
jgi:hypothetical protein